MDTLSGDLNETMPAKVTTAGDLAYATAANAITRLGIGANAGALLVTNTGLTAPMWSSAWTIPPATGHVLPLADNSYNLGSTAVRPATVFAGTALKGPGSTGAAAFVLDTNAVSVSLTAGSTFAPFGGTNNFAGLFSVFETNGAVQALFMVSGAAVFEVSDPSASFSITKGTTSLINVYTTDSVVSIQNSYGVTRAVRVSAWRTTTGA